MPEDQLDSLLFGDIQEDKPIEEKNYDDAYYKYFPDEKPKADPNKGLFAVKPTPTVKPSINIDRITPDAIKSIAEAPAPFDATMLGDTRPEAEKQQQIAVDKENNSWYKAKDQLQMQADDLEFRLNGLTSTRDEGKTWIDKFDANGYYDHLAQAKNYLTRAQKQLNAPEQFSGNKLSSIGKAITNTTGRDLETLGFSDAFSGQMQQDLNDKIGKGEPLTDGELIFLEAIELKSRADEVSKPGSVYKAISSIPQNLPFIAQIVASGGATAALRKGIVRTLEKGVVNATGKELANISANRAVNYIASKAPAAIGQLGATTAVNVPFSSMFATGITENQLQGQSTPKAILNSLLIAAPEYYFEGPGSFMKAGIADAGKFLGKRFKSMIPTGQLSGMYKGFKKAAQYDGFIGENLEEQYTGITQSLLGGQQTLGEFFSGENQKDLFFATTAMSLGFGAMQSPGKIMDFAKYQKSKSNFSKVDPAIQQQVESALAIDNYTERWNTLRNIDFNTIPPDQQAAVFDYFRNKTYKDLYTGWMADDVENETKPIRNTVTGNIHPIEHKLVKNEDGTNKQFFIIDNLDEHNAVVSDLEGNREVVSLRDAEELPVLDINQYSVQQASQVIEEQEISETQAVQTEANQQQAAQFQPGQSIVYDNKQFTISEIQPDGSIIADDLTDENSSVLIPATDLGNITTTVDQKPGIEEINPTMTGISEDKNPGIKNQIQPQEDILGITEQPIGEQPTVDNGQQDAIESAPVVSSYPIVLDNKPAGNAIQNPDGTFTIDTIYQSGKEAESVKKKLVGMMEDEGYTEANFQVTSAKLDPNNPFSPKQYKVHIIPPQSQNEAKIVTEDVQQNEPFISNEQPEVVNEADLPSVETVTEPSEVAAPAIENQVPEAGNMVEPVTDSNALDSDNETDFVIKNPGQLLNNHIINKEIKAEEEKVNTEPSEAQKEAGNYQKGHIKLQGFDISIENPKGSTRSGVDKDGKKWEVTMNNTYGYFLGTEGKDKDHVDVFIGDNPTAEKVWVVDQINDKGVFDEHKVMMGMNSEQEARESYLKNYSPGWKGLGAITEMPIEEFRSWVFGGKVEQPLGKLQPVEKQPGELLSITEFPKKRVTSAYSHLHLSPYNTALVEENEWNKSAEELGKTIKQYLPEISEEEFNTVITKYKSDYILNREPVWKAAGSAYSSAVAGRSNFNKKQSDSRGRSLDRAEERFSQWLKTYLQDIEDNLGITKLKEDEALKKAEKKANTAQLLKEAKVKVWSELKVGDELNIGNSNGNPVISKKNKFSVETSGGAKWTLKEVYGVDHAEAQQILDKATEKNPGALLQPKSKKKRTTAIGFPKGYEWVLNHDPRTPVEKVLQYISSGGKFDKEQVKRELGKKGIIENLIFGLTKNDGTKLDTFFEENPEWNDQFGNSNQGVDLIINEIKEFNSVSKAAKELGKLIETPVENINPELLEKAENAVYDEAISQELEDTYQDKEDFFNNLAINGIPLTDNKLDDGPTSQEESNRIDSSSGEEESTGQWASDRGSYQGSTGRVDKNPGELLTGKIKPKKGSSDIKFRITPEQAKDLNYKTDLPKSEEFLNAVSNTKGAKITKDGLILSVIRYQRPEQENEQSVRTGVFYLPSGDANTKHYKTGKNSYGGTQKQEGETLIKKPLFVKGATGGKAPEAAYDQIKGKGSAEKLGSDIRSRLMKFGRRIDEGDVYNFLEEYGADGDLAWNIVENSKQGNTLVYAVQENIIAHAVRESGYDSVIGYSKKRDGSHFISEIFDVRETTYPSNELESDIHDSFLKEMARFRKAPLYSNTERALSLIQQSKGTPEQFKAMLLKNGAKQDELNWMDWDSQFANQKSVTKEEIQNWLDANKIEIKEVVKSKDDNIANEIRKRATRINEIEANYHKEYDESKSEKDVSLIIKDDPEWRRLMFEKKLLSEKNENDTKYSQYTIPGGKNYREALLTLPSIGSYNKSNVTPITEQDDPAANETKYFWYFKVPGNVMQIPKSKYPNQEDALNYIITEKRDNLKTFKSNHWDETNIAAHIRMNEFTTKDGKRALNIEEVQSDWGQKVRKEKEGLAKINRINKYDDTKRVIVFYENGQQANFTYDELKNDLSDENITKKAEQRLSSVPDMPFKKTDQWAGLGMKWALRYAAENGFDVVTWTNGETQAERYDLSKQVDNINYSKNEDGTFDIYAMKAGGTVFREEGLPESKLEESFGKDVAQKIINDEGFKPEGFKGKRLEGDNLKVGGEGMKGFYDQILPTWTKNYTKKWGAKVSTTEIDTNPEIQSDINTETGELADPTSKKYLQVHSVEITPEMRESVMQGQPMFKASPIIDNSTPALKQSSLQEFYDSANKGTKIIVTNNNRDVLADYLQKGGSDASLIEDLEDDFTDFSGMYVPEIKTIYIKPKYVNNQTQAELLWIHENGIHFGADDMLSTQTRVELFQKVYDSIGADLIEATTEGNYSYDAEFVQGEEYIAAKAENNFKRNLIDQKNVFSVEEIDELLSKGNLTTEDIDKLINTFVNYSYNYGTRENEPNKSSLSERSSNDSNVDGQGIQDVQGDSGSGETVKLRSVQETEGNPQIDTPEFKRWFGSSKVVDENGNPLVVYHGTASEFNTFDKSKAKDKEGRARQLGWGKDKFYFTPSEISANVAANYAKIQGKGKSPNIIDAYLSVQKPISAEEYDNRVDKLISRGKTRDAAISQVDKSIKLEGYDGIIDDISGGIAVFESNQIKSASGNNGNYDSNSGNIYYRRPPRNPGQLLQNPNQPHPQIKKNSLDYLREGLQDSMLAVRKLQSNEGLTVDDISNIYLSDNQKNSRSMGQKEAFRKNFFMPFLETAAKIPGKNLDDAAYLKLDKRLKQGNITVAEWEAEKKELDKSNVLRYMIAKHAPERNAYFKGLGKTGDNYAGMTDQEAAEVVSAFENMTTQEEIDNLWEAWNKATEEVMNMWVKYGRYDAKSLAEIKTRGWKYYVPLRGWEPTADEIDWDYQSNGGRGEFSGNVKATGRKSIADNPLASLDNMAQSAILWGEKNRVKQAAYRLVKNNKTRNELFYVKSVWNMKDANGKVNEVIKEGENFYSFDGWTRDGDMLTTLIGTQEDIEKDGSAVSHTYNSEHYDRKAKSLAGQHEIETYLQGRKYIVVFRDPNIANEINKIGITGPIPYIAPITRFKSKVVTSLNPVFVMKNLIRDFLGGGKTLFIEQDLKTSLQFAKNWGKAVYYVGKNMAGNESNKYAKYWQEYTSMGGRTGSAHLESLDTIKSSLKKDIRKIQRSKVKNALINTVNIFKHLDTMAQYSENLARFSAYVTAREQKKSMVQSINMAKEVTVNFDRKGKWSGLIGSFMQFFNASMQGADKQIMQMKNNTGKYFLATATSLAAQGYLISMLYDLMSGDDDKEKDYKKPSKYTRYNNAVIGFEDTYLSIPLAQGYRMWNALGCIIYDLQKGEITKEQASFDYIESVLGSLSPIDASKFFNENGELDWKLIAGKLASPIEPLIQSAMNQDFKGDPMRKVMYTKDQEENIPESQQYLRNTNPVIIAMTDGLFRLAGGDPKFKSIYKDNGEKVQGMLDVNPATVEFMTKSYTGGVGTTVLNAVTAISQATMDESEKTKLRKQSSDNSLVYDWGVAPVINGFYRSKYQSAANEEFKKLDKWHERIDWNAKEAKKTMDFDRMIKYMGSVDNMKYIEVGEIKNVLNDLYDYRKQVQTIEQINIIDLQITQLKRNMVLKYSTK
jgi:hypothetical protein